MCGNGKLSCASGDGTHEHVRGLLNCLYRQSAEDSKTGHLGFVRMSSKRFSRNAGKTLTLFSYDWDAIEFKKLSRQWSQLHAGFDLFSFPSSARLAWFDIDRFCDLAALKAKVYGARGVVSNHEQFGALCAALVAERMQWPGTPVEAVLACQHKLYAREVL